MIYAKIKFYPFILFIFLCLFFFSAIPAWATSFMDVPGDHWAASTIQAMTNEKIISGYGDGNFRPNQSVTREEFAVMLIHAAKKSTPKLTKSSFLDVKKDAWSANYIEAAKEYFYYTNDTQETYFYPERLLSREEAAAALARAKGLKGSNKTQLLTDTFTDYQKIKEQYRSDITAALENKLIAGYQDGSFKPQNTLTRAEAASLLYQAFLYTDSLSTWINQGIVAPFTETDADYEKLVSNLHTQYGTIAVNSSPLEISYQAKDLLLPGKDTSLLYVFARIDPLKYFTFSDSDYRSKPEIVKQFINTIAQGVSKANPQKHVLVALGYTNIIYYNPKSIFDTKYVTYLPAIEGWKINRIYVATSATNGNITDSWEEE